MLRIDSHQHFWKFDPVRDSWINDDMKIIQRDFLPIDLLPVLQEHGFDGCVTVQSDQSEAENEFQLKNAQEYTFVKGVVGWVDLQAENIEDRLSYYRQFKKLKGFRHVLQGEKQRDFMLRPAFKNGIGLLKKYGFTYDILIFPDQPFVIDHLAKPYINDKKIDDWRKDMQVMARHGNVFCKISGMVTEADWKTWKPEEFTPYLDAVVEAFGVERLMFGSDWPVCLVAANYRQMLEIVTSYFQGFSENEKDLLFGGNAIKFYNLV